MGVPKSSLRAKLARLVLVTAMISLVALFATAARAQTATDTATETAAESTPTPPPALPATDEDDEAAGAEDVRLPNTGGNLAVLGLIGLTVVEVGAGLLLLAGTRKRV